MSMDIPRLVIAAAHSSSGKTTLATGLMAWLTRQGYSVQGFKVGPDYIDPAYHQLVTGRPGCNLDEWFLGADGVKEAFVRACRGADIAIVEGVMGLFDGYGSQGTGSTASIAKILNAPVLVVLDVRSLARTAAALVRGLQVFDPDLHLAGVIVNRVGSPRHAAMVKQAIEENCALPVLAVLPSWSDLALPERHLGLKPVFEQMEQVKQLVDTLVDRLSGALDADRLWQIARTAVPVSGVRPAIWGDRDAGAKTFRLGVVYDEAFNFYYWDGLDYLATLGAELVFCRALDGRLPADLDGLYIGGGFPEMFASRLATNRQFMADLKEYYSRGLPVYAECGGLMYLCRELVDLDGEGHCMAGLIPARCIMQKRRAALGYVTAHTTRPTLLGPAGTVLKGHEFHYSTLQYDGTPPSPALEMQQAFATATSSGGYAAGNLFASYLHLHWAANPRAALNFSRACRQYARREKKGGGGEHVMA